MSRIAVVGGGLYGSTIAVDLARAGHRVDLFERRPDILLGATRANQGRLHRGWHYPRSSSTAREAMRAAPRFEGRFAQAVDRSHEHLYAIAKFGLTRPEEFALFAWQHELKMFKPSLIEKHVENVEMCVRVWETFVRVDRLRAILRRELEDAGVRLHVGAAVAPWHSDLFDVTVWAAYGAHYPEELQRELVEVGVFELSPELRRMSLVVLDGPFCSIDPVGDGRHYLYDVVHSVHVTTANGGMLLPGYVDAGLVHAHDLNGVSRWRQLRESAERFVPLIKNARWIGSMFTVRSVLPGRDAHDDRPWCVETRGREIHVLPGKLASCLSAADKVVELCA